MAGEHLDVDLFAAPQSDREAGVVVAVKEPERRRFDRGNENRDGAGGQLPQGRGALLLHVGMRREIFEGKHVVRRQPHHAPGQGAGQLATGAQHRLQRLGGLVVGHHHDDRLAGGPRHQRQIERPRRGGQSGDTPTPRTKAQMPSYALKTGRVLQLREDFADERENHVYSVYQCG